MPDLHLDTSAPTEDATFEDGFVSRAPRFGHKDPITGKGKKINYHDAVKCEGLTHAGNPCGAIAKSGSKFCQHHTPKELLQKLDAVPTSQRLARVRSIAAMRALALPKGMASRYEAILQDPQLVQLKNDIAFTETRIQQITQRISRTGDGRPVVRFIKKMLDKSMSDLDKGRASIIDVVQEIREVVDKEFNASVLWEEVYQLTSLKRKLVETESKRMKDLEAFLTPEQAFALVTMMVALAKEFVPAEALPAFQEKFAKALKLTKQDYRESPVDEFLSIQRQIERTEAAVDTEFDRMTGTYEPEGEDEYEREETH